MPTRLKIELDISGGSSNGAIKVGSDVKADERCRCLFLFYSVPRASAWKIARFLGALMLRHL